VLLIARREVSVVAGRVNLGPSDAMDEILTCVRSARDADRYSRRFLGQLSLKHQLYFLCPRAYSNSCLSANLHSELSLICEWSIIVVVSVITFYDKNVAARLHLALLDRTAPCQSSSTKKIGQTHYQVETSLTLSGLVGIEEHSTSSLSGSTRIMSASSETQSGLISV
jgi:hypothetical protein